jgi:hypothetical protein
MVHARSVWTGLAWSLPALVVLVLGVDQLLARQWRVETTRVLQADPARVGALVRDLATWPKWVAIEVNLGPQTARAVTGQAGSGSQRIEWSGQLGRAVLTATAVTDSSLDYTIGSETPGAPPPGHGRVEWRREGNACRVRWIDEGVHDRFVLRWIGWFGALQERIKQIHGSSLEALQQQLEPAGGAPR